MGLEMYGVYHQGSEGGKTFHEWQNHEALNERMKQLYLVKGKMKKEELSEYRNFYVELNKYDLDALETAIKDGNILDIEGDMEFIGKAREHIAASRTVSYWASW